MRLAVGIVLACLAACVAQAAEPLFPKNGTVGMAPPPGMSESAAFQGFEHPAGASIMIVEVPPGAAKQMRAKFTDPDFAAAMATKGIKVNSSRILKLGNSEGTLLIGTQTTPSVSVNKWMLFVHTDQKGAIITAQSVVGTNAFNDKNVLAALQSVTFRGAKPVAAQAEALAFRFGDLAGFKLEAVQGGSAAVLSDPALGKGLSFITALGIGWQGKESPRELSLLLLNSMRGFKSSQIVSDKEIVVNGDPTYELIAVGTDTNTGTPTKIVQWVRFYQKTYLRTVCTLPAQTFDSVYPRFAKVRDGITFR